MTYHYTTDAMKLEDQEELKSVRLYQSNISDYYQYGNDKDYFNTEVFAKTFKGFDPERYYYGYFYEQYGAYFPHTILNFTEPEFNGNTKTVEFYESVSKKERGIKTTSKIGKYIRKIAPYYNDKQIECLVNIIVEDHIVPNYTYHTSKNREDFKEVYRTKADRGGAVGQYKCLNASCMRYDFGYIHPAECYGSGDFEIHWITAEGSDGIAARCIVCLVDNIPGPIYAATTVAGNELKRLMQERGISFKECSDDDTGHWEGAKLLKLESYEDESLWVVPYLDGNQCVKEHDDYFEITALEEYDHELCEPDGFIRKMIKCKECGDQTTYFVEIDGENYCDCCTVHCSYYHQYVVGEGVTVYTHSIYNYYQYWSLEAAKEHAVWDEIQKRYYTVDAYAELTKHRKKPKKTVEENTTFKVGDRVRKKDGTTFGDGLYVNTIQEPKSDLGLQNIAWVHSGWIAESRIEHAGEVFEQEFYEVLEDVVPFRWVSLAS